MASLKRYPDTQHAASFARLDGRGRLSLRDSQLDFDRVAALGWRVFYGGGAIEFVPGEGATLNGALQGAEENERKYLAVGKALQPHLAEQPGVFAGFGLATLQGEG